MLLCGTDPKPVGFLLGLPAYRVGQGFPLMAQAVSGGKARVCARCCPSPCLHCPSPGRRPGWGRVGGSSLPFLSRLSTQRACLLVGTYLCLASGRGMAGVGRGAVPLDVPRRLPFSSCGCSKTAAVRTAGAPPSATGPLPLPRAYEAPGPAPRSLRNKLPSLSLSGLTDGLVRQSLNKHLFTLLTLDLRPGGCKDDSHV